MTALLLAAALVPVVPAKTVWINEDNQHFYDARWHGDEDMTAAGCRRLVDRYADVASVTGILFCVNMQRALYDSNVWERFKDQPTDYSYQRHLRLLSDRGVDQFKEWLDQCRKRGLAAWLTMRMNDCHGLEFIAFNLPLPEHQTVTLWASELWRSRPDLRRAPYRIEHGWEGAFDYLKDEVYAHHLALVREIFSKWDMDGLELDWMRWGMNFPPGGEYEGRAVLTRFVKDVRKLADGAEKRLGHRVRLSHRVPPDPETCLRFGYDVGAWADAGCVDMITLAGFENEMPNDTPVELWRRILRPGTTIVGGVPYGGVKSTMYDSVDGDELHRGSAAAAWACGVDALSLFNACYREPHGMDAFATYIRDLSSLDALNATNRRCAVTGREAMPGYSQQFTMPEPLRLRFGGNALRRMDGHITLRITTGAVLPDATCELSLCFDEKASPESLRKLEVRLNTAKLAFDRRLDLDLDRVDRKKCWVTCLDYPRDAKTVLVYRVPATLLHARENAIEILPPADAEGSVVWADVKINAN